MGHLGRFVIWTEAAIECLSNIYGTNTRMSVFKHNYRPPRPIMKNSDFRRIIMSQEIQSESDKDHKEDVEEEESIEATSGDGQVEPGFCRDIPCDEAKEGKILESQYRSSYGETQKGEETRSPTFCGNRTQ